MSFNINITVRSDFERLETFKYESLQLGDKNPKVTNIIDIEDQEPKTYSLTFMILQSLSALLNNINAIREAGKQQETDFDNFFSAPNFWTKIALFLENILKQLR